MKRSIILYILITFTIISCGGSTKSSDLNSPPSITLSERLKVIERDSFSYSPEISDIDGNLTSWGWTQLSGPTVEISQSLSFVAPSVSEDVLLTFKLTATDDFNATTESIFEVLIQAYSNITDLETTDTALTSCILDTVTNNSYEDLGSISDLDCSTYNIQSINNLSQLTKLTSLNLDAANISELSQLSLMEKLIDLTIQNLQSSIFLASMPSLNTLRITKGQTLISNHLVGASNLTTLGLSDISIDDPEKIGQLNQLHYLFLSNNNINDFSWIDNLTLIKELRIYNDAIDSIEFITNLTQIEILKIISNQLSSIPNISQLTKLHTLKVWDNELTSIDSISTAQNIENLALGNNHISEISAINSNIKGLDIRNNDIVDITHLSNLKALEVLNISQNKISNINALSSLSKIKKLVLSFNNITDISTLSSFHNLEHLELEYLDITDISSLLLLTKLETLNITGSLLLNCSQIDQLSPSIIISKPSHCI